MYNLYHIWVSIGLVPQFFSRSTYQIAGSFLIFLIDHRMIAPRTYLAIDCNFLVNDYSMSPSQGSLALLRPPFETSIFESTVLRPFGPSCQTVPWGLKIPLKTLHRAHSSTQFLKTLFTIDQQGVEVYIVDSCEKQFYLADSRSKRNCFYFRFKKCLCYHTILHMFRIL